MAKLKQAAGGLQIQELCPEGTYIAVIGKIEDRFGVERRKYDNPNETELVDETRFTFGVLDKEGNPYRVQTYPMKISGHPKSKLFAFLTNILGQEPKMGWDYCELEGSGAIIKVAHKPSRDGTRTYANIVDQRPVKDDLNDYSDRVPPVSKFDWGEEGAEPPKAPEPPQAAPAHPQGEPQWSPESDEPPPF